jgi:AcrR family transcriptional regulator
MKKSDSSIDKLREKKKKFLARETAIRDSAISLLKHIEADSVTVSLIAKDAGIGKGTIYKHFLSKTEILMRIVSDYERNICESIRLYVGEENDTKDPFGVIRKYFSVRLFDPSLDRLVRKLTLILEDGNRVSQALSEIRSLKEGVDASIISSIHPLIKKGFLQDFPSAYYHFAYISFIDGVIDKCADNKYKLDDHMQAELLTFISSIGSDMGRIH